MNELSYTSKICSLVMDSLNLFQYIANLIFNFTKYPKHLLKLTLYSKATKDFVGLLLKNYYVTPGQSGAKLTNYIM